MGKSANSYKWFITISKYNQGTGLTDGEIEDILKMKLATKKILVVQEFRNRKQQDFSHCHIVVYNIKTQRQDTVMRSIKEQLKKYNLYNDTKDLDVRAIIDDKKLIGGYLQKSDDFKIWRNTLETSFIEECKKYAAAFTERKLLTKGMKRPSLDEAPLVMEQYIEDHHIEYDCSNKCFLYIFKEMIKSRKYLLTSLIGKTTTIKSVLDILISDNHSLLQHKYDAELMRLPYNYGDTIIDGNEEQIYTYLNKDDKIKI